MASTGTNHLTSTATPNDQLVPMHLRSDGWYCGIDGEAGPDRTARTDASSLLFPPREVGQRGVTARAATNHSGDACSDETERGSVRHVTRFCSDQSAGCQPTVLSRCRPARAADVETTGSRQTRDVARRLAAAAPVAPLLRSPVRRRALLGSDRRTEEQVTERWTANPAFWPWFSDGTAAGGRAVFWGCADDFLLIVNPFFQVFSFFLSFSLSVLDEFGSRRPVHLACGRYIHGHIAITDRRSTLQSPRRGILCLSPPPVG
jgi:hypothetical protein